MGRETRVIGRKEEEGKEERKSSTMSGRSSERIAGTEIVPSSSANVRTQVPKDRSTSLRFLDRASARARVVARVVARATRNMTLSGPATWAILR